MANDVFGGPTITWTVVSNESLALALDFLSVWLVNISRLQHTG